jgi:hypothetical protein
VHSLRCITIFHDAHVTVRPRVGSRAQLLQEGAGLTASLRAEALSPFANTAVLLHAGELAVGFAAEDFALLPEIGLRTDFLDLVEGSVGAAGATGAHCLVVDGHIDVGAIPVDWPSVSLQEITEGRDNYRC